MVRNKIKMFAQQKVTLPKGRHKIIILDEADRFGLEVDFPKLGRPASGFQSAPRPGTSLPFMPQHDGWCPAGPQENHGDLLQDDPLRSGL